MAFGLGILASAAEAADDDFYKGKSISVIIGSTAGGAYDQYGRYFSRYIGKYIPGSPNVVAQNMPGAGGVQAGRYIDGNGVKDGTVIVTVNSNLITTSLTEPETMPVKFDQVAWIGAMTHEFRVCYSWFETPIKNWDDMAAAKEFVVGATGTGTGSYVNGAILHNLFKINIRQVLGYPGAAQQRLAVERGELQGACSEWNAIPLNWITDKKINPVVKWIKDSPPDFNYPGAPYIGDKASSEEIREIIAMLSSPSELGNPFMASKQVPAERLKMLRDAFDKMVKDADLKAELDKAKQPLEPTSWADAEKIVGEIYKTSSPNLIAKAKEAMK
jgi:tripartite-type tricarboxylate transporter receptor subunit TctC